MPTLIRRINPNFGSAFENDPLRLVRDLLRWDGFAEPEASRAASRAAFVPTVDIKETPNEFIIQADLPGVAEKDVEMSVTGNQLTISGKREFEQKQEHDQYVSYERSFGSFTRSFAMPDHVDSEHIGAELKDGVLTLHVPKRPEVKARKIELKGLSAKTKA